MSNLALTLGPCNARVAFFPLQNDDHKTTDRTDEVKKPLGYHQGGFLQPPVTQGTGRNEQHKQAAMFKSVNSITLSDKK